MVNTIKYNKNEDYNKMVNLVKEDFNNYFNASLYLQNRYDFCLEAIYSCLISVNNMNNKFITYFMLHNFLDKIKKKSGINMQIIKKDKLYVKEKSKKKKIYH